MNSLRARRRRPLGGAAPAATAATPPYFVARLVPLERGFYVFSVGDAAAWRDAVAGFAVPAVHICAAPDGGDGIAIVDAAGRAGNWLGGRRRTLFLKAPAGGVALVTAYLSRIPQSPPVALQISPVDPPGAPLTLHLGETPVATPAGDCEIVARIRGRGDVSFVDAAWAGRLAPGLWLEALTIKPSDPAVAAAIEYKGLTATGAETPWLGSGSPCGATDGAAPLIGFAVRQKAAAGAARFDCEYSGYFASGTTVGPVRNGAPCRSPVAGDPLEGIQLRITPQ